MVDVFQRLFVVPLPGNTHQKHVQFHQKPSVHLQDSKILDQHCKNAPDILARLQDAVLDMASFAISSLRDL